MSLRTLAISVKFLNIYLEIPNKKRLLTQKQIIRKYQYLNSVQVNNSLTPVDLLTNLRPAMNNK